MNPLHDAAAEVQDFCNRRGWRFCLIGGLAVARWSEPRTTQDVDISLFCGFGAERSVIDQLAANFALRIPNAAAFAEQSRVLLLQASNGIPVDIALAGLPFEERMIERSSEYEFLSKVRIRTVSAEDLIVLKAFAGRPRDWLDIDAVLIRQRDRLNRRQIIEELAPLCELKDDFESVERLREMMDRRGV